jgi:IS5 family transposase
LVWLQKHVSLDIQSGLINKVAVTQANVTGASAFALLPPSDGAIYADKGYCTKSTKIAAASK